MGVVVGIYGVYCSIIWLMHCCVPVRIGSVG